MNDFISKLTLEEKSRLVDCSDGPCRRNIAPIPRLNFKVICLQDSPLGVREAGYVTIFPAGITPGASFDRTMIRKRGLLMAQRNFEQRGLTSPSRPLGWSALGGRNGEGFGACPYLAGIAILEMIAGFNEHGVQSTIKHWIGNEQETMRKPSGDVHRGSFLSQLSPNTFYKVSYG
ncbi:putative beta-glucosidase precursor [Fusarium austroafricanum]|uniref:beta-glucosidase n=1 Tax=Fusarium austroafricanum TaxID=2364996 RepID=A0A8H4P0A8_9HYPO|nr:putative beta-glucosidase precursor [Fusarium austroafricanum]